MSKYITLFFFCFSFLAHSQEKLKVTYEVISNNTKVNFGSDPNLSEDMKKQMLEKIDKISKEPKKYTLCYYDGNTYFAKDNSSATGKQKQEFFKVKNQPGFYILNDFKVEEFYGYYPDSNFEIEYKDEALIIEKYLCKLAIVKSGNEVNKVWYTEEIPISTGPFIYNNLPGLVMKIERPNYLCYAVHVSNDCKEQDVKKMNPILKVYQGEELKIKSKEGLDKRMNHSREVLEKRLEKSK
jgi:GLPGLI family protein